jgi:hypothetical protein
VFGVLGSASPGGLRDALALGSGGEGALCAQARRVKAYVRFDPLTDERKAYYTDGQFRAFMLLIFAGARQNPRGRFRSDAQLRALLGRHARYVPFLVDQGDIRALGGGEIYIDGWDEWQEGDLTVGDRMARLRNRQRNGVTPAPVTR